MLPRSALTKRFVVYAFTINGAVKELSRWHTYKQAKAFLISLEEMPGMKWVIIRDISIPGKNAPYSPSTLIRIFFRLGPIWISLEPWITRAGMRLSEYFFLC